MPLTSKGNKILAAMRAKYGEEKGEGVFYASKNAGKITGVDEEGDITEDEAAKEACRIWEEFGNKSYCLDQKKTKAEADYEPVAKTADCCDRCEHFTAPNQCGIVDGSVSPDSWCKYFAQKMAHDAWAFDAPSAREFDHDGRLHVELTPISKANVCPYTGREIQDANPGRLLGLDNDKIYHMLRHPDELKKAADSSNGIQLLKKHIGVNADSHKPYDTVGATGTDATFDGTHLKNSLVVWAKDAIDDILSEEKKELSCAYYYTADMTPGVFDGQSYDGVMRDIKFNHVALVPKGRAGPDVCIADSAHTLLYDRFERAFDDWSPEARQKAIEARKRHAGLKNEAAARHKDFEKSGDPHLVDFLKEKFGEKWVVAKATENNKNRYREHNFISQNEMNKAKKEYASKHPAGGKFYGIIGDDTASGASDEDGIYLDQENKKYRVKIQRDGKWSYDCALLTSAAHAARMVGKDEIAKRADAIREREIAKDEWSDEARQKAIEARRRRGMGRTGKGSGHVKTDPEDKGGKEGQIYEYKRKLFSVKSRPESEENKKMIELYERKIKELGGDGTSLSEPKFTKDIQAMSVTTPSAGIPFGIKESKRANDEELIDMSTVALSKTAMLAKGALHAYLRPRLAADAAIELDPFLIGLKGANFEDKKAELTDALTAEFKGKLAKDASLNGLGNMLDLVVGDAAEEYKDEEEEEEKKKKEASDKRKSAKDEDDDDEKKKKESKASEDQWEDDDDDEDEKKKKKEASDKRKSAKDGGENMGVRGEDSSGGMVSKKAMDEAISKAVKAAQDETIRLQNDINEARNAVSPWVGALPISFDSPEKVYRQAVKNLGCEAADSINEIAALKALLELHPKPGVANTNARSKETLAQDSSAAAGFFDRFPDAKRIRLG